MEQYFNEKKHFHPFSGVSGVSGGNTRHHLNVLVFKTSICEPCDLEKVAAIMEHDPRIVRWNVDRDDVDKVLRIEANHISTLEVKLLINAAGFYCEELPD